MFDRLVRHMGDALHIARSPTRAARGGSLVAVLTRRHRPVRDLQRRLHGGHADLPDGSVHLSVYSPPFAGLYVYSSDERDLSNARLRRVHGALRVRGAELSG